MLLTEEVQAGWRAFLGRLPDARMLEAHARCADRSELVSLLSQSQEFNERIKLGHATLLHSVTQFERETGQPFDLPGYVVPQALSRSEIPIRAGLIIGACLLQAWPHEIASVDRSANLDFVLIAPAGSIAAQAPRPLADYDCALLQVPLRMVLPDYELFERAYGDVPACAEALTRCTARLEKVLRSQLDQLASLPVFVLNYMTPQQSALGRLLPRYDLRNPSFFVEELNRALAAMIAGHANVHLFDIDQLSGTIGRRLVQDDVFSITSHGSVVGDYDTVADRQRLEQSTPLRLRFPRETTRFIQSAWAEVVAMMRTLRGADRVKLVCVDIDDTLWRGVAAELDDPDPIIVEGWPIGFAEALAMLERRGIILALVSKNDPDQVARIWPKVFHARLQMSHFAIQKINWRPKPENILEAIAEANVLPESVLFIDDNPVERASVEAAIPGIRTLGAPHLDWRRILLWSAETQVAAVSAESGRRTEMIRAQGVREVARGAMDRAAFLADLDLSMTLGRIESVEAPSFPRAFELLNKTNQFNTTGRRWTQAEAAACFAAGGKWWTFTVTDRFTAYGLVGVLIERDDTIEQFVMSCRVFGLGVEQAALAEIVGVARAEGRRLFAVLRETERNGPCRQVYAEAGWIKGPKRWRSRRRTVMPSHIRLTRESV